MPTTFSDIVDTFINLIYIAVPVVALMAVLVFFWGLAKFIFHAGDEKAVTEGRSLIVWGLIGLFVMFSLWGIIRFFYGEVGFTQFGLPLIDQG